MGKLGVIGGMGPMATAQFLQMAVEMTDAEKDQEHIEMIIYNAPQIADRTAFILGESGNDPEPQMAQIGKQLAAQEVDLIVVPCVTASYFLGRLKEDVPVEMVDVVEEIGAYVSARGYRRIGLMATKGTVQGGRFQEVLARYGCQLILPSAERQQDVMHVIYNNVKANRPVETARFMAAADELRREGAEVIILGCTELSLVRERCAIGAGYLDAMQLMAKCAVERCGRLRREYEELVTGE